MKYTKEDWRVIRNVVSVTEALRKTRYVPNPRTRGKPGGSTGNLAFDALRYEIKDGAIIVYVNKRIAPYVPYTNEPWLSAYWRGKKNPNEGWWQRFVDQFAKRLARKLKGELIK